MDVEQLPLTFGDSRTPTLEEQNRVVWNQIRGRRGRANGVKNAIIAKSTGWSRRMIHAIVRRLVDQGYHIYGSKRPPYGYFVMKSVEEFELAAAELETTGLSMLARSRLYRLEGRRRLERQVGTFDIFEPTSGRAPVI